MITEKRAHTSAQKSIRLPLARPPYHHRWHNKQHHEKSLKRKKTMLCMAEFIALNSNTKRRLGFFGASEKRESKRANESEKKTF